jgi:hypothetical protein
MSEDHEKVKMEGDVEVETKKLLAEEAAKNLNQSVDSSRLEVC